MPRASRYLREGYSYHLTHRCHEGSVWEHPYHCTIIQDGRHLLSCLRYVHLNMVRAGVVNNPSQWRWSGHDELTGTRSRYRILDVDRLLYSLDMERYEDMQSVYNDGIVRAMEQRQLTREPGWTESLAVGDRDFVELISQQFAHRRRFAYSEHVCFGDMATWAVRETQPPYISIRAPKTAAKPTGGPL